MNDAIVRISAVALQGHRSADPPSSVRTTNRRVYCARRWLQQAHLSFLADVAVAPDRQIRVEAHPNRQSLEPFQVQRASGFFSGTARASPEVAPSSQDIRPRQCVRESPPAKSAAPHPGKAPSSSNRACRRHASSASPRRPDSPPPQRSGLPRAPAAAPSRRCRVQRSADRRSVLPACCLPAPARDTSTARCRSHFSFDRRSSTVRPCQSAWFESI